MVTRRAYDTRLRGQLSATLGLTVELRWSATAANTALQYKHERARKTELRGVSLCGPREDEGIFCAGFRLVIR
jgi:hypothetical protein